jgi:hypothetical protein
MLGMHHIKVPLPSNLLHVALGLPSADASLYRCGCGMLERSVMKRF